MCIESSLLRHNRLPDIAVIDIEASGLHTESFPIEIAWCFGDMDSDGFLIRPHHTWEKSDWSWESQMIHGIPIETCEEEGIDAREAATRLNAALDGKIVLSDAPPYDSMWLERLYAAAGIAMSFEIDGYNALLNRLSITFTADEFEEICNQTRTHLPYTHRAEDDVRYLMGVLLWVKGHGNELSELCYRTEKENK